MFNYKLVGILAGAVLLLSGCSASTQPATGEDNSNPTNSSSSDFGNQVVDAKDKLAAAAGLLDDTTATTFLLSVIIWAEKPDTSPEYVSLKTENDKALNLTTNFGSDSAADYQTKVSAESSTLRSLVSTYVSSVQIMYSNKLNTLTMDSGYNQDKVQECIYKNKQLGEWKVTDSIWSAGNSVQDVDSCYHDAKISILNNTTPTPTTTDSGR